MGRRDTGRMSESDDVRIVVVPTEVHVAILSMGGFPKAHMFEDSLCCMHT